MNIFNAIDAITGARQRTQRRTRGRTDHRITSRTPRHDIYMTCGVCIPAPRYLGITGSNGTWHVPWLSQVGVKILGVDYGGVGSNGRLLPRKSVDGEWSEKLQMKVYPLAQWVRITVRADNGVPKWAELLCVKYEKTHGKAKYWKDKTGIVDRRNWRYADNAHGVPMPMIQAQKDCAEVMTPPDLDKPRR